MVGDERIQAGVVLWAAGVAASPAAKWLGAESDRAGRVKVSADLSLPGHPEVFVIGDTALATDAAGNPLPGVAPAAKQAGKYVARVIRGAPARPADAAVPLPQSGQPRHHRPHRRGRRFRLAPPVRLDRVAALGGRPHLLPDRLSQPARGRARLALGLPDLPARRAADHRALGRRGLRPTITGDYRIESQTAFPAARTSL